MPVKKPGRNTLVMALVAVLAATLGGDFGRILQAAVNAVMGAY